MKHHRKYLLLVIHTGDNLCTGLIIIGNKQRYAKVEGVALG